MYCPKCGSKIDDDYNFCPVCGYKVVKEGHPEPLRIKQRPGLRVNDPFSNMLGGGLFDDDFLDSFFRSSFMGFPRIKKGFSSDPNSHSGGFSVKIIRGTGQEPKVSVNTFGDFKGKESDIKKQMGLREEKKVAPKIEEVKPRKFEKTEQPECCVSKKDGATIIEVDLPKVKSLSDVDIAVYNESIEIRAYANKTAFFSIIKIPAGANLIDKVLEKGKLKLTLK